MEYSAQRQSGSVITYVIVGVLLAAVAVGAIIVAQNRGNQPLAERPSTELSQPPEDASKDKNASSEKDTARSDSERKQAQKEAAEKKAARDAAIAQQHKKEQREAKEAEAAKVAEEAEAARIASEQQAAASASGPMARTGGTQPADALPTTGPVEDTLSMVIGLLAISGAGYFYYHAARRG